MKFIRILWEIMQLDVINRLARMTGLTMLHTHSLPFEERLQWRLRMK